MRYKLDKIDLDIVRNLKDGRTPYSDIAEKMGLSTNTVRNRANKMMENNVLQIISLVSPNAIENHSSAFIGFKIHPHMLKPALEQISSLKGIVGASAITGRFDIMSVFLFNEEHSYNKFIHEELEKVDGLISMETFFAVGGKSWQLRYVL